MLLWTAAGLLILSQVVGVYALVTRKADLIFSIVMLVLLVLAVGLGAHELLHKLD